MSSRPASTVHSNAFAAALAALGVSARRSCGARSAKLPAVLHRGDGRVEDRRDRLSPLNPTYTERELEASLDSTGARTVVTLTPFYAARQGASRRGRGPHA